MNPTPKKRATAADKAAVLTAATEMLSSRVGTLADAVQINNHKIDQLQHEINKKPDDIELHFISGLAKEERQKFLKYSVITALTAAAVASSVSYLFAQMGIDERVRQNNLACIRNNERAMVISDEFRNIARLARDTRVKEELIEGAGRLDGLRAQCDKLHPLSKD